MIPYGHQDISESDVQAVVDVLRSDFLTQGPMVPAFEDAVARYCGVAHAVAANSATSALHIACLALGVGVGDAVWTSPITFVASANCARYCGASVDFVEIDRHTYNLSVDHLAEKLERAEREGNLPKVVIPVHLAGQSCEMDRISQLGKRYGFKVIEDAAHGIGGQYQGEPIGSCRYSDITVFSFHPVKIITTAEGGVAVTNDSELAKRMRLLRSHGITHDAADMAGDVDGPWHYHQIELGFNYRMTDVHAALGLSQMRRLDKFVARRHAIARRYDRLLSDFPIVLPWSRLDCYSAYHLYLIRLRLDEIDHTKAQVFEMLRAASVGVNVHYTPVYRQPYYEQMGFEAGYCPEAEQYYSEAITLPLFPEITEPQQDQIVAALRAALG